MAKRTDDTERLRTYRNTRLYRPLGRLLRVYNRFLIERLHAAGFEDFSATFPALLSNLDTEGTRVGVLAARAGVTRQAAGQLLAEIERRGYVECRPDRQDARATIATFTPRGRKMLATVFELVEEFEGRLEQALPKGEFARVRQALVQLVDQLDPGGGLGQGDRGKDAG